MTGSYTVLLVLITLDLVVYLTSGALLVVFVVYLT